MNKQKAVPEEEPEDGLLASILHKMLTGEVRIGSKQRSPAADGDGELKAVTQDPGRA